MKFMSQRPSQLERHGYHELAFILDTPHRLPWIFGLITVKPQHTTLRDLSWLWHWHLCLSLSRLSCVHVSNQVGIASSFCRHLMILLSLHQLQFNNPGLPLQVFPYIILDHHKISTSHNNYHNSVRWSIFNSIFFYIFFPSIQKNSIHKQSSSGQSKNSSNVNAHLCREKYSEIYATSFLLKMWLDRFYFDKLQHLQHVSSTCGSPAAVKMESIQDAGSVF